MNQTGSLDVLIRRARRRHLFNVALKQAVLAVSTAVAGLILLLLLGTEILDWRWIVAVFAAGLIAGLWNLRRQVPSPYRVAQSIDRRLGLSDTISTAYFYHRMAEGRHASAGIRAAQFAEADRMAREAPIERAAPLETPRSLYAMAGLVLAASGLLTLRYGIFHTLDLRPPLATILFDNFHFLAQAAKAEPEKPKTQESRLNELLKEYGLTLEDQAREQAQEDSNSTASSQSAENQAETGERRAASEQPEPGSEQGEQSGEAAGNNVPGEGDQLASNAPESREESSSQSERQSNGALSENNSLLQKFRDAMQNLMSRMKTQPSPENQQMARAQGQSGMSEQQAENRAGSQQAGKQLSGKPGGDQQGEQPGEGEQMSQGGSGKQGNSDAQQGSEQSSSGVGKEDGSKDIKEAEQLAAMGKISEIIGRRSESLTGEAMVEVASGRQRLKTDYSQRNANHAEAGGAISRDEIPLAYQRYVQQYFEEVRKAPPAPANPGR